MADQQKPAKPAPVDQGLADWAKLVHDALTAHQGVEIIGIQGGSVHFKFRGQEFAIHVHRVT